MPSLATVDTTRSLIAAAVLLAAAGTYLLLPRPRGRAVALGTVLGLLAVAAFGAVLREAFGPPARDAVGEVLFWLFAAGAVVSGGVLVVQKNPARGAIAFAFVVLSTCGLFLLLAAPFLMAATVIIYAGAIIVTFLFLLMLSHAGGPSDENDRSREPLLGSLAGFGFAGLVLFALYQTAPPTAAATESERAAVNLPAPALTNDDRAALLSAADELQKAAAAESVADLEFGLTAARMRISDVVGFATGDPAAGGNPSAKRVTVQNRLRVAAADPRARGVVEQANALRERSKVAADEVENLQMKGQPADAEPARAAVRRLREDVLLLAGRGELPARNVGTLGLLLYSEHLLSVELAGTLLLVATIGAVAIAGRKGGVA